MGRVMGIGILLVVLQIGGVSFAGDSPGAGQAGDTILLGYDVVHLSYREFSEGSVIDRDTGWQNGGYLELRHDENYGFVRISLDIVGSDSAKYDGVLLPAGTPISISTRELVYKTELDAALKAWNLGATTLSPYLGVGYRWWDRGRNQLPDYLEKYTWWYGTLGINVAFRASDRLLFGLDGAMLWPLSPRMKTDTAGTTDEATFDIRSRMGYRFEAPAAYGIYRAKGYTLLAFLTPYYERWNIAASDFITLTKDGAPVDDFFEPKSHTEMYGLKAGFGMSF